MNTDVDMKPGGKVTALQQNCENLHELIPEFVLHKIYSPSLSISILPKKRLSILILKSV